MADEGDIFRGLSYNYTPNDQGGIETMIERHLKGRGICDEKVLEAMRTINRREFMPEKVKDMAWEDHPVPIGYNQTISQPYIVALITEALELKPTDRVLEIGAGSGYQAAVISHIVKEGFVYAVERIPELVEIGRKNIAKAGIKNIEILHSDGTLGYQEQAPYDKILFSAAAPGFPPPLVEQLKENGIIVGPVGSRHFQNLIKGIKKGDKLKEQYICGCVFVPLIGEHGMHDS